MVDIVAKWSAANVTAPSYDYTTVTPSDTVDEAAGPFRALYIGVAGDFVVVKLDNTTVLFKNSLAGSIIPIIGRRVNATLTTATNLVGLR